jgi:hypothetical protein
MAQPQQESAYADSPTGWASRWQMELAAARKSLEAFYKVGREVDTVLRDEKENAEKKRLCLFPANNQTIGAMLYGRTPEASVGRKFADADDDVARVASEMLERVLNCDVAGADDTFSDATRNAMLDWRGPGMGIQRHRYEVGMKDVAETPAVLDEATGQEIAPAVAATQQKAWEKVNTDWVPWDEFLWSPCRTWDQVGWVAFVAKVSEKKLAKQFGEEIAKKVPKNANRLKNGDNQDEDKSHPWDRAAVWEIWHRDTGQVFFVVEGHQDVLVPVGLPQGEEPGMVGANGGLHDPLGLPGFFPCQRPMMANLTTSKLIPVADYKFAQDLYKSVDVYTTRIGVLSEAARLAGAYDKTAGSQLEQIVKGGENKLYPVDNWAAFAEKGGLRGAIDYLPLDQIVAILQTLRDLRREDMDLIFQVTGQSDLVRGQQTANGTPGEAKIKAKSASVRMQAMQDEIARFASEGQQIRAHIISKHFSPETIIQHSNIMATPDAQYAQPAVELIKSRMTDYRIEVKPEAINLTDFAALKEERFEVLGGIANYMGAMMPAAQMLGPSSMPYMLKMLQVTVAGLRGGSAYESILDQWITDAEQQAEQAKANPQQAPPDPKIIAAQMKMQGEQMKAQAEMAKVDKELQADATRSQIAMQENEAKERTQATWNVREHEAKQRISQAFKPPVPPKAPNGGFVP